MSLGRGCRRAGITSMVRSRPLSYLEFRLASCLDEQLAQNVLNPMLRRAWHMAPLPGKRVFLSSVQSISQNSAQLLVRGFLTPISDHRPPIMQIFIGKRIMKINRQTSNAASDRPKCTHERHSSTSSKDTNKRKMHSKWPNGPLYA